MQLNKLFCNGQPKARTAGFCGPGGIQAIKLLKDTTQLFLRIVLPQLTKRKTTPSCPRAAVTLFAVFKAVVNGIANQVIKDAFHLIHIAFNFYILIIFKSHWVLFCQQGLEFKGNLLEHPGQVYTAKLQGQLA